MNRGQAERLLPMLMEMMSESDLSWSDIDVIGVMTGPGNFTGVRIGVAAARGLAMATGKPAVGATGFDVCAFETSGQVRIALEDARGGVFEQLFQDGTACSEIRPATAEGIQPSIIPFAPAIVARIALNRTALGCAPPAPPAPLYLRAPDAAPSKTPIPHIIDDA